MAGSNLGTPAVQMVDEFDSELDSDAEDVQFIRAREVRLRSKLYRPFIPQPPRGAVGPGTDGIFLCQHCGHESQSDSEYDDHLGTHRICFVDGCSKIFDSYGNLTGHLKATHRIIIRKKYYTCPMPQCQLFARVWPRLDIFQYHVRRTHRFEVPTTVFLNAGGPEESDEEDMNSVLSIPHRNTDDVPVRANSIIDPQATPFSHPNAQDPDEPQVTPVSRPNAQYPAEPQVTPVSHPNAHNPDEPQTRPISNSSTHDPGGPQVGSESNPSAHDPDEPPIRPLASPSAQNQYANYRRAGKFFLLHTGKLHLLAVKYLVRTNIRPGVLLRPRKLLMEPSWLLLHNSSSHPTPCVPL
ncbi:hypothetical protein EJ06DRAFT_300158 [Trichodelitschia bisporula]|uniref:C2H2-type domain-containing protein n=1 Tax=Trichodelitschia bisporula TaxID=703511 RepID=A0A6G1I6N1_9PEZI|nr:hypothetical protein EJ06DRAFT_300158 [Trichodelitschia bisporula]